jgi:hypothetical protein
VCDCAINIAHHTRKLAAGSLEYIIDDVRGASAIRDAVRSLRILNIMSAAEGAKLGFDEYERLSYFRVDQGKANTKPPAKKATWHKFESVILDNGDNVGVVTPWEYPDEGSSEVARKAEGLFLQLLDRFTAEGRSLSDSSGATFAPAVFAKEPQAKAAKVGKVAFVEGMRRLFAAGAIKVEEYGNRGSRRIARTIPTPPPTEVD